MKKKTLVVLGILIVLSLVSYALGEMVVKHLCDTHQITDRHILDIVYGEHRGIDRDLFFAAAIPFGICYYFLKWIGSVFGWTYQEASVYICIYAWQILLILSTIPILIKAAINCIRNKRGHLALILSICYTALYCDFTAAVFDHYPISDIDHTFNQCVQDLRNIALYCNVTYETVNICIYLIGFMVVCWVNYLLFSLIGVKRSIPENPTPRMEK